MPYHKYICHCGEQKPGRKTNAAKPISFILTIEAEAQELFLLGQTITITIAYYYYSDFYIGIVRYRMINYLLLYRFTIAIPSLLLLMITDIIS